jgi:hypothetical protein
MLGMVPRALTEECRKVPMGAAAGYSRVPKGCGPSRAYAHGSTNGTPVGVAVVGAGVGAGVVGAMLHSRRSLVLFGTLWYGRMRGAEDLVKHLLTGGLSAGFCFKEGGRLGTEVGRR